MVATEQDTDEKNSDKHMKHFFNPNKLGGRGEEEGGRKGGGGSFLFSVPQLGKTLIAQKL